MTYMRVRNIFIVKAAVAGIGALALASVLAACGSSAAKTPPAATPTAASAGQRRIGNRTPSPALQTSIAEGTPAPFGALRGDLQTSIAEGTPAPFATQRAAVQTSIAEGTPAPAGRFGNAPPSVQTAIAEGTRPAGGFGIRGRLLTIIAGVLNEPESQLQTELQVSGATIASVGNAHGFARDALRQALLDAYRQDTAQQVQSGAITQAQADQMNSQFTANIDSLLDSSGTNGGPPPPAGAGR
ncbi:MAG TPA: hypothetical protein VFY79_06175 [Dehalococcoidia bacterium]|nr:hypothetical protein [Dehalococcoidia bacterium]